MGVFGAQPDPSVAYLYVGQNRAGHWIVTDGLGRRGAIFTNRCDALRFAASCQKIAAVFLVLGPVELSFSPADVAPSFLRECNAGSRVRLTPLQMPSVKNDVGSQVRGSLQG